MKSKLGTRLLLVFLAVVAAWIVIPKTYFASRPQTRAVEVPVKPYRTAPVTMRHIPTQYGIIDHVTMTADFYAASQIAAYTKDMTGRRQKTLTFTRAAVITGGGVSHVNLTGKDGVVIPDGGVDESTIYVPNGMISVRGPVQNSWLETAAGWVRAGIVRRTRLVGKYIDAACDSSCSVLKVK